MGSARHSWRPAWLRRTRLSTSRNAARSRHIRVRQRAPRRCPARGAQQPLQPSGDTAPTCSANVQPFLRSNSANKSCSLELEATDPASDRWRAVVQRRPYVPCLSLDHLHLGAAGSARPAARSAQSSHSRGLVRRSTATSWRNTSNSASFDAVERASTSSRSTERRSGTEPQRHGGRSCRAPQRCQRRRSPAHARLWNPTGPQSISRTRRPCSGNTPRPVRGIHPKRLTLI
jgi:hypothetical protein